MVCPVFIQPSVIYGSSPHPNGTPMAHPHQRVDAGKLLIVPNFPSKTTENKIEHLKAKIQSQLGCRPEQIELYASKYTLHPMREGCTLSDFNSPTTAAAFLESPLVLVVQGQDKLQRALLWFVTAVFSALAVQMLVTPAQALSQHGIDIFGQPPSAFAEIRA